MLYPTRCSPIVSRELDCEVTDRGYLLMSNRIHSTIHQ